MKNMFSVMALALDKIFDMPRDKEVIFSKEYEVNGDRYHVTALVRYEEHHGKTYFIDSEILDVWFIDGDVLVDREIPQITYWEIDEIILKELSNKSITDLNSYITENNRRWL